MNASTITAVASVITTISVLVAAYTLVKLLLQQGEQIEITKKASANTFHGIDTYNESTLGELGSQEETRRIEAIDKPKRTPTEQRHLDSAPPKEQPQGEDA